MALRDDDHQLIRDRHATGNTLGSTARELGVASSTVSRAAKRLGLECDRSNTERATERHKATNAEKRATLETRLLDEADLLLDQLHNPHLVYNFGGRDNEHAEHVHDEPDVAAKKALVQAAGTAVNTAMRLAEADKAVVAWLFAALQLAASRERLSGPEVRPD